MWRIYGPNRELLAISFSAALTHSIYQTLTADGLTVTVEEQKHR